MQVRQVAVLLLDVEAVADEELIRDREADVANREVLDEPAVRPVEQRRRRQRRGLPQRQRLAQVVEREAGVDHVLDDDDVPVGDLVVEVFEQPDAGVAAGVRAGGVARELDEVDPVRDLDGTREVGQEDEARLQRRDEERFEVLVVVRDLATELTDTRL